MSEATSPFAKIPTLSPIGNSFARATMFANDKAWQEIQQRGVHFQVMPEALVIAFDGQEMAWMQMGQPHLFLRIRGGLIFPARGRRRAMRPDRLLGRGVHLCQFLVGSSALIGKSIVAVKTLALSPGDRFAMLARSGIPQSPMGSNT